MFLKRHVYLKLQIFPEPCQNYWNAVPFHIDSPESMWNGITNVLEIIVIFREADNVRIT
jgi:hypothetical protein